MLRICHCYLWCNINIFLAVMSLVYLMYHNYCNQFHCYISSYISIVTHMSLLHLMCHQGYDRDVYATFDVTSDLWWRCHCYITRNISIVIEMSHLMFEKRWHCYIWCNTSIETEMSFLQNHVGSLRIIWFQSKLKTSLFKTISPVKWTIDY